jgi:hypothetical protein
MAIEFWPRSLLKPRPRQERTPKKPKPRRPKLPIAADKARQMLSSAILIGDHELASWIDGAVMAGQVLPKPQPQDLHDLRKRLDEVMQPLAEQTTTVSAST